MAVNLIATTVGALQFLASAQAWQEVHQAGVWHVHLFANNYTVVAGTTLANLTEASFVGYSLAAPTWSAAAIVSGVPTCTCSTVTFTQTSAWPSTSYGVYVTDAANSGMVGAANFTVPVVLTAAQPSYALTVSVTCKSEF